MNTKLIWVRFKPSKLSLIKLGISLLIRAFILHLKTRNSKIQENPVASTSVGFPRKSQFGFNALVEISRKNDAQ